MGLFDGRPLVHELVGLVGADGKAHKVAPTAIAHHGHIVPSISAFWFDEIALFSSDENEQIAIAQQVANDGFAITLVGFTRIVAES